jgi:hypothetical protein
MKRLGHPDKSRSNLQVKNQGKMAISHARWLAHALSYSRLRAISLREMR